MSLKRKAASGATWTGISSAVVGVIHFLQLAILARLLRPEDFGLMAMLMVVLQFAQAYADMGISNAIIHRQDTTREQLSTLYWLNILAGSVVFLLVVAATPLIVALYGEPRLHELVPLAALVLLLLPPGQQFQILLQKSLRFRALALIEIAAALVGAAVAIGSALGGQGVLSLIWGYLALAGSLSLCLLAIGLREWRPRLRFRRDDLKGYVSFGLFQLGDKSLNYLSSRIDQLLIGALLGAQALGYYNVAFNLVVLPLTRINPILTRVAFPMFSLLQNDTDRLRQGFMAVQRVLATVNFPIFVGMATLAWVIVPTIFGDKWLPSVALIQILAFVALLRSGMNPAGSLLLAKGRVDLSFYWNLSIFCIQLPVILIGAHVGESVGVAIALLIAQLIYFALSYFILVRRLLGPCLEELRKAFIPGLVTSSVMGIAVGLTVLALDEASITILVAQVLAGAALYLALNWLFFRRQSLAILDLVWQRGDPG